MLDPKELNDLTVSDLSDKEKELRKELFNLRFQSELGQMQNPMQIRSVRRDIARVLTFIKVKGVAKQSS